MTSDRHTNAEGEATTGPSASTGVRDLTVGVFRPDDGRLAAAVELIEALGATPIADPMLAVEPTGATPRRDADAVVLTSVTGVDLATEAGWTPDDATLCAIGDATADALVAAGHAVDVVPDDFSSTGLVATLDDRVDGARVEVARSDHGSAVLTDGLEAAGAYVHETVLYRLVRPDGAGESVELAAAGELDAAAFTSSLTVENFVEIAEERGISEDAIAGLNDAVVGAIGEPTRATAQRHGIAVDVVPSAAVAEDLICTVVERGAPTYHE